MLRFKQTLLFTGIWFWSGMVLLAASAYGLLAFDPLPPGSPTAAPEVLVPATRLYAAVAYYGSWLGVAVGLVYVVIGWVKARKWTQLEFTAPANRPVSVVVDYGGIVMDGNALGEDNELRLMVHRRPGKQ
jgi:hypothetical protein